MPKKWQVKVETKLNAKLPENHFFFGEQQLNLQKNREIERKLAKIFSTIKWPVFLNQTSEQDIQNGFKHILAAEIVFRHFHSFENLSSPPAHASDYLKVIKPTPLEGFFIHKYSHLIKNRLVDDSDCPKQVLDLSTIIWQQ